MDCKPLDTKLIVINHHEIRKEAIGKDGWFDASKYLPIPFDLCLLKINPDKITPGWHTGQYWDGLKVKDSDEVIAWKNKNN